MSGLVGLDYSAVAWILRLYEVEDQRLALEKLQVIEATVLQMMHQKGSG